ncbi:Redoxin, partial [Dimargaris cristalligena]
IQAGQPLPNLPLQFESPATELPAFDHFARFPRALLVGVPGAFTPGCSQSHLPGFISRAQALADLGVQQLGCVAVNDAFVMQAWAQSLLQSSKVGGKGEGTSGQATAVGPLPFQFLADPQAKLVGALGLSFDATAALGNWRARRFVLILENGVVREVLSEPDNVGITVTRASHV